MPDQDDVIASRIRDQLQPLAREAQQAGMATLSYLIEMAVIEAEAMAGETPASPES